MMRKSLLARALAGEVEGFIGEDASLGPIVEDEITAEAEYRALRAYYGFEKPRIMPVNTSKTVH